MPSDYRRRRRRRRETFGAEQNMNLIQSQKINPATTKIPTTNPIMIVRTKTDSGFVFTVNNRFEEDSDTYRLLSAKECQSCWRGSIGSKT